MHESLSYQSLPSAFLDPVLLGLVPLRTALELWDLWLMTPDGGTLRVPQRLQAAAELVFQQDVLGFPTVH